jgi:hypothetical protein
LQILLLEHNAEFWTQKLKTVVSDDVIINKICFVALLKPLKFAEAFVKVLFAHYTQFDVCQCHTSGSPLSVVNDT